MTADIELLFHIPARRLPTHVWNLRNTLFTRTGFHVSTEEVNIQFIKAFVQERLPQVFPQTIRVNSDPSDNLSFAGLTWTIRSEISQWVRDNVAAHTKKSLK